MGLKQIIRQKKILASAIESELELPGEPMIYCIKYPVGARRQPLQFFRNAKWKSLLKCFFKSYYYTNTPVVLVIKYYVSPPSYVKVSEKALKQEKTPAVFAYELCDYTLSFLELLHHVLINSYKQIVKMDVSKFYSKNPRTVFQFMKWEHYVNFQRKNSIQSSSKGVSAVGDQRLVQSESQRDGASSGARKATARGDEASLVEEPATPCNSSLPHSCTEQPANEEKGSNAQPPTHKKTRQRQLRKVPV